jgi:hypothetical protein
MLAGRPAAGQAPDISSSVWFLDVDLFAFPQSVSTITQK